MIDDRNYRMLHYRPLWLLDNQDTAHPRFPMSRNSTIELILAGRGRRELDAGLITAGGSHVDGRLIGHVPHVMGHVRGHVMGHIMTGHLAARVHSGRFAEQGDLGDAEIMLQYALIVQRETYRLSCAGLNAFHVIGDVRGDERDCLWRGCVPGRVISRTGRQNRQPRKQDEYQGNSFHSCNVRVEFLNPMRLPWRLLRRSLPLIATYIFRPGALDVIQHGGDLLVGQGIAIDGHGARPADIGREPRPAKPDGVYQLGVAVMPGVAAGVVGWRAKRAVGVLQFPAGLAFEVYAMTFGAMKGVDLHATGDLLRVESGWVVGRRSRREDGIAACPAAGHQQQDRTDKDIEGAYHYAMSIAHDAQDQMRQLALFHDPKL